jgi:hypothetical protein
MEILVKFTETFQFALKTRFREDKRGDTEVISSRSLSESAAGHKGNTSLFENFKTVKQVNTLFLLFCCCDRLGRELDGGEGIHGAFNFLGVNVSHAVEGFRD